MRKLRTAFSTSAQPKRDFLSSLSWTKKRKKVFSRGVGLSREQNEVPFLEPRGQKMFRL